MVLERALTLRPKLRIIVTGQIRDEANFHRLIEALKHTSGPYCEVIFCSWPDVIDQMKAAAGASEWPIKPQFIYTATSPFVSSSSNRDISSFIAQIQTLSAANFDSDSCDYVLRLRADHHSESVEQLVTLFRVVTDMILPRLGDRAVVFGADDCCPFFFEDRVMLASRSIFVEMISIEIGMFSSIDYFNMFPEFLLYSSICRSQYILRHDHRFSKRARGARYSAYDVVGLGGEFEEFQTAYVSSVINRIVFYNDIVDALSCGFDRSSLDLIATCIPRNFPIVNMAQFLNSAADARVEFRKAKDLAENLNDDALQFGGASAQTLTEEKVIYNEIYKRFFQADHAGVISLYGSYKEWNILRYDSCELYGCSMIIMGHVKVGILALETIFNRGFRGFEQLFYLARSYKAIDHRDDFVRVCEEFKRCFGHISRTQNLIDELIR